MTLEALLIYGSRARGDHRDSSDADLLGVMPDDEEIPTSAGIGGVTLHLHRRSFLRKLCRAGELFGMHLAFEAKGLFDPLGVQPQLRREFAFKESYERDVQNASEVGWLLARNRDEFLDPGFFNRRAAWVARTILIARSAERRAPIFSQAALHRFSQSSDADALISSKNFPGLAPGSVQMLTKFLREFGTAQAEKLSMQSVGQLQLHFEQAGNRVGQKAVAELLNDQEPSPPDDYFLG